MFAHANMTHWRQGRRVALQPWSHRGQNLGRNVTIGLHCAPRCPQSIDRHGARSLFRDINMLKLVGGTWLTLELGGALLCCQLP